MSPKKKSHMIFQNALIFSPTAVPQLTHINFRHSSLKIFPVYEIRWARMQNTGYKMWIFSWSTHDFKE